MNKNSKIFLVIGIVLIIGVLIISILVSPNDEDGEKTISNDPDTILDNAKKESKKVKDSEKKDFKIISIDDYFELLQGNDSSIILIGRDGCQYCQIAEPIIHKIAKKYDLDINYLGLDDLEQEDLDRLLNSSDKLSGVGTPVILIVSNNDVIDKYDGMTDTAHYEEFFEKNNFIK